MNTEIENNREFYELIIIGGGAAGFSAATVASELGIKTVIINDGLPIGGTCVNVGCVPSKILIEMANRYYYTQFQSYDSLIGKCTCSSPINFKEAVQEKDKLVKDLRNNNYRKVLAKFNDVAYIKGKASFINDKTIRVNDKVLEAEHIVITTGSRAKIIPFNGLDSVNYLTSKEALELDYLPKSLIVVGGGSVGLELAQMFHHFGSEVTILESRSQITYFDKDISENMQLHLEEEGINIHLDIKIKSFSQKDDGTIIAQCIINEKDIEISGTDLLLATGVVPNVESLNLENTTVKSNSSNFIEVDEYGQTSSPIIWAAGDVTGKSLLETTSARQGFNVAKNIFENKNYTIDYSTVPQAIFTTPQVATVGFSEKELITKDIDYEVKTIFLDKIPKALALKDTRGLTKMAIESNTRQILGVQIISPHASELIHEATLAVRFKLNLEDIINTLHVFPTMSESIKRVAQSFDRDVETMACCIN